MGHQRFPKSIPEFSKSYALLSDDPSVDTTVVFVHGFGGRPTSTWLDFHGLVKMCSGKYPWWQKSDLFFYSYESLKTPILANAERLGLFLNHILSKDENGALRFSASQSASKRQMVLVGHSEGAVVIRRMLLDRFNTLKQTPQLKAAKLKAALKADIVLNSRLRLFAPACMGTNFSSLLGFATSFSTLIAAVASSSLVRNELLKDSPVLTQIREETDKARTKFPNVPSFTANVLFGVPDQVVYTVSYSWDDTKTLKGHDHFSICKPQFSYLRPLEFVS